jgi:hypothetical protein
MISALLNETIDPATAQLLDVISQDMDKNPDTSAIVIPKSLIERAVILTTGIAVDLDDEIIGDVSI